MCNNKSASQQRRSTVFEQAKLFMGYYIVSDQLTFVLWGQTAYSNPGSPAALRFL
jgi:hypothetical protein